MEHYYSEHQSSTLRLRRVTGWIRGNELHLYLASGVFSRKRMDKGALLLANVAVIKKGWEVLDMGCGNGIIGIAVAKAHPSVKVLMSDINERAIKSSRMNVKLNRLDNCIVRRSDGFSNIEGRFNTILFNPPQTAGRQLCERLILESKHHLKPQGILQMVARHNKGGKSLNKFMAQVFGNTQVLKRSSGYRVYVGKNG